MPASTTPWASGEQSAAVTPKGFVTVDVSLDWGDGRHWDYDRRLPCRICQEGTNLRDDAGDAACKTCVEADLQSRIMQFAQALIAGQTVKIHLLKNGPTSD